ncbi:MAG: dipeptidase [Acidobacteriota bacterium]|nr:dipeptidase [Acidobacteriota bacterium]
MTQRRIPFLDFHAHFPMHTPFPPVPFTNPFDVWKKGLFDSLNVLMNFDHGKPRVSLERWFADNPDGGVTGFGSVLYDAEDDFFVDATPIPNAFSHILRQLENVERELKADPAVRVMVARNPREVEQALLANEKFVFHTLEGGFSLGGDAGHVQELAKHGVASVIPAHLFYRGVATCEDAFPAAVAPIFRHELENQPPLGLTPLGEAIVEECFRRGVIVDITHAREDAQDRIFEIAAGYPRRPVISSHNSVRHVCNTGLNLSDDAIHRIQRTGGVIGVIFYVQWLRHLEGPDDRDDFTLITDVIDHIRDVTGSDDHVSIGSDLDGFIEPIRSCATS